MDRRELLSTVGTGFVAGLAGCSGIGGSDRSEPETAEEGTPTSELGKAYSYNDIRVEVEEYTTADRYFEYPHHYRIEEDTEEKREEIYDRAEEQDFVTPKKAGGVFLLARVVVKNVGENSHFFPGPGDIELVYNGEVTRTLSPTAAIRVGDTEYDSYSGIADEVEPHREGAFPGYKLDGWMVFEAPATFSPGDVEIRATWGDNEENMITHAWTLGEPDRPSESPTNTTSE